MDKSGILYFNLQVNKSASAFSGEGKLGSFETSKDVWTFYGDDNVGQCQLQIYG